MRRIWERLFVVALLMSVVVPSVQAQPVRSPELNVQFHRAETAWRSGASMLEAKARVDRVLTALPNDVEALKLRARVLLSMDRSREALHDARQAVRLQDADAEAHLILCEAARRSGDDELAERALNKAAELVTDDPMLHVQLSWNAVLLGKLDEAEAFARIAVAADANNAAAHYQLARVFILKQQTEDAATILENGLRNARLDAETIEADTILVRVAEHPSLRDYLKK